MGNINKKMEFFLEKLPLHGKLRKVLEATDAHFLYRELSKKYFFFSVKASLTFDCPGCLKYSSSGLISWCLPSDQAWTALVIFRCQGDIK